MIVIRLLLFDGEKEAKLGIIFVVITFYVFQRDNVA
jgi:hypothetical protein